MPTIRLPSEARALDVDADGLAMQVRLTPHEVAQLWAGVALNVADGAVRRLAASLGVEQAALLVSGAATANDSERSAANEDCDPEYDDAAVVVMGPPAGRRSVQQEDASESMSEALGRVLVRIVAESNGRYTDEDAAAVLKAMATMERESARSPEFDDVVLLPGELSWSKSCQRSGFEGELRFSDAQRLICAPVTDDGPSVMASAPERGARVAEPEAVDAQEVLERVVANSDGRYNDEDAELVAAVLTEGEMPPTLTGRELPAFLRAWLEPACALRAVGRPTPEMLLVRVVEDGPKSAAKMARGIQAKIERAVAAKAAKAPKKASKG